MRILLLDNYDSFTYNLLQYLKQVVPFGVIEVIRNDQINLEEVAKFDVIVLSPGPGIPKDAGIMPALIKKYAVEKSILGVCLGHQAIGEAFGGSLTNMEEVYHGISTPILITGSITSPIFESINASFEAGRYHSWIVNKNDLPDCLMITAVDDKGRIMAFSHKEYNVHGVQFHPESVMTPDGMKMLSNFIYHSASRLGLKIA
ncbi:MAG: anthranilate synthase component II [Saprospiraceae bacterium]|jgi:anthranilate synthase component 2